MSQYSSMSRLFMESSDNLLGRFLDLFSTSVMSLINCIPDSEDVSCWGCNANSTPGPNVTNLCMVVNTLAVAVFSLVQQFPPEVSGLSYFAIQIQSWFVKTQSKFNHSPKNFSNVLSKSKGSEKCSLFTTKMPHFFYINSVQIRSGF